MTAKTPEASQQQQQGKEEEEEEEEWEEWEEEEGEEEVEYVYETEEEDLQVLSSDDDDDGKHNVPKADAARDKLVASTKTPVAAAAAAATAKPLGGGWSADDDMKTFQAARRQAETAKPAAKPAAKPEVKPEAKKPAPRDWSVDEDMRSFHAKRDAPSKPARTLFGKTSAAKEQPAAAKAAPSKPFGGRAAAKTSASSVTPSPAPARAPSGLKAATRDLIAQIDQELEERYSVKVDADGSPVGKDAPVFALNTVKKLTSELSVLKTIHAALSKAQQDKKMARHVSLADARSELSRLEAIEAEAVQNNAALAAANENQLTAMMDQVDESEALRTVISGLHQELGELRQEEKERLEARRDLARQRLVADKKFRRLSRLLAKGGFDQAEADRRFGELDARERELKARVEKMTAEVNSAKDDVKRQVTAAKRRAARLSKQVSKVEALIEEEDHVLRMADVASQMADKRGQEQAVIEASRRLEDRVNAVLEGKATLSTKLPPGNIARSSTSMAHRGARASPPADGRRSAPPGKMASASRTSLPSIA